MKIDTIKTPRLVRLAANCAKNSSAAGSPTLPGERNPVGSKASQR